VQDDSLRSHPAVLAFTSVAQRYCTLLEHPIRDRDLWLADLHSTLAALYAAAPVLRDIADSLPPHPAPQNIPESFRLTNDQWTTLYTHLKQTLGPAALYSAHFNPLMAAPTDEPTPGDLADDLADIYRDIKPGLSAFNSGDDAYLEDIFYQWLNHGYVHHWGRHAADALRALHWLIYK
jgi:Domain of unknown function (DUF5063)